MFLGADGRVFYEENGAVETICGNQWDDVDAGVLCRHLGMGMGGQAKFLSRDTNYSRAAYGVYCYGNETNAFDCRADENDTTHGMCDYFEDAAVECHGKLSTH